MRRRVCRVRRTGRGLISTSPRDPLALVFGVRAALELFEVGVALVLQLVVDADLRGVVTIDGQILDRLEEALFQGLWLHLILADLGEQRGLLLGIRAVEVLRQLRLA